MKNKLSFLAGAACALLLALPLAAASATAVDTHNNMKAARMPAAWPAETLSGKIMMVDPAQNVVVIQTPDGTPYDMVVTPRTRIDTGDQRVTLSSLSSDMNQMVSVHFVPESRGDVARSISLGGM